MLRRLSRGSRATPIYLGLFLIIALTWSAYAQTTKSMLFGLTPNISTRNLLVIYQPMQRHLESRLGQAMTLYSAPNFARHYERAVQGEYDLVLMPAHLAQLLIAEAAWVPIAQYKQPQEGLVLVNKTNPITLAKQLQGKTLALTDPLSLNTLRAEDWLRQQGWKYDPTQPAAQHYSNHAAAVQAVVDGQVTAAIVSSVPFSQIPEETRRQVRVIGTTGSYPANVFLANPALNVNKISQMQSALLEYAQTSTGTDFLRRAELEGIKAVQPGDFKWLEPYAKRAKAIMQRGAEQAK